jgi:hypothetical protein
LDLDTRTSLNFTKLRLCQTYRSQNETLTAAIQLP